MLTSINSLDTTISHQHRFNQCLHLVQQLWKVKIGKLMGGQDTIFVCMNTYTFLHELYAN